MVKRPTPPKPMKEKPADLTTWKWAGWLVQGGTFKDFKSWMLRSFNYEIDDIEATGCAMIHPGYPWVLWVEDIEDVATLSHEALHVTTDVLQSRGIILSRDSVEAFTYTMEDVIRQALDRRGWRKAEK